MPIAFYARPTRVVARELLGCLLLRRVGRAVLGGRIVETEAYLPNRDPACHAARGRTRKNASMFGPPGRAYVYPIHAKWCFNVVTEGDGVPAAVLIRAIEPLLGLELQIAHRGGAAAGRAIASGPARLCQALDIDRQFDGWDLTRGRKLWLQAAPAGSVPYAIQRTPRIGVTSAHGLPLRYVLKGHPFLSARRGWPSRKSPQ